MDTARLQIAKERTILFQKGQMADKSFLLKKDANATCSGDPAVPARNVSIVSVVMMVVWR